jgi:hypothetical protein
MVVDCLMKFLMMEMQKRDLLDVSSVVKSAELQLLRNVGHAVEDVVIRVAAVTVKICTCLAVVRTKGSQAPDPG